jgi:uncharacterized membrane protein YdjX (TVP38/TMEM64 family)
MNMAAAFVALAVIAYLVLLVDWKNLNNAISQGGWGALVLYAVITVLIVVILSNPDIPNITPH